MGGVKTSLLKLKQMDSDKRYKEVIKEIESNIELLKEKLKQHQVKQSKQPENWGFVGDISYVNTRIENIIHSIGGV